MSKIKADMDENTQAAQAEIDRIAVWRNEENEKLQRSVSFFEGLLHEYFMQHRETASWLPENAGTAAQV